MQRDNVPSSTKLGQNLPWSLISNTDGVCRLLAAVGFSAGRRFKRRPFRRPLTRTHPPPWQAQFWGMCMCHCCCKQAHLLHKRACSLQQHYRGYTHAAWAAHGCNGVAAHLLHLALEGCLASSVCEFADGGVGRLVATRLQQLCHDASLRVRCHWLKQSASSEMATHGWLQLGDALGELLHNCG